MIVPMASIGEMSMGMCLLLMRMSMSVFDTQFNRCVMLVLVVFVMYMLVFMLQQLVGVFMLVMLQNSIERTSISCAESSKVVMCISPMRRCAHNSAYTPDRESPYNRFGH